MKYLLCSLFLFFQFFSFGQSARKVHERAILVDTHNDFLSKAVEDHYAFDSDLRGKTQSDLDRMQQGGIDVQVFSIFCDEHFGKGSAFAYANQEIDSLYAIASRNPDRMQIVYNSKQLLDAVKHHKLAALSGVEGGHMIEDDLSNIDSFYKRGVRYISLTWNNSTSWATSAADESKHEFKITPYGLNDFGKEVVKRMNRLGMLVDVSHSGEQTFWDVIHTTTKPIIASHSSVYAICPVFRNLKDDQIRAIAKNGGVIQVNFYSGFVDSTYMPHIEAFVKLHRAEADSLKKLKKAPYEISDYLFRHYQSELQGFRPPLSLLIDHIDYIVKLVGVDYVGLGSDFDGIDTAPVGLDGVEDYPKITEALLQRGYKKKDIDKILGGNFLRVLKANEIGN
ncbi:MAG TPA: dipeptidase [Puia sp.]|nr:dipeptidase [Puia sp.]